MKKTLIAAVLALCCAHIAAQIDHAQLLQAYFAEDLEVWRAAIDRIDDTDTAALRGMANYEYGYIGFCIGRERFDEAKSRIATMKRHLNTLEQSGYDTAMLNLYRSALCAFELSMNRWKFATLGVESVRLANLAYEQAPENPFVLSLKGNTDFYRPALAGGSKKRAIELYEKAVALYERQQLTDQWNYYATLLTLAQAYEKTDDREKAKAVCRKLLEAAPEFKYVRDKYYPSL